jgi:DNA-binding IclR family transcriptional regulator
MDASTRPSDLIHSLWRGMQLLELLAAAPEGLLAKTISRQSGLNPATCYHLLNTLSAAGYVVKDPKTQRFSLTGKIVFPAQTLFSNAWLVPQLQPHLQTLRDTTRETAYLSLRQDGEIVVSAILESPQALRVSLLHIGYEGGNHATALGKAILAYMDPADTGAYLECHGMPALTPHTITDPQIFKAEMATIRARGYSLDHEEFAPGVCCIGAPVFNNTGQVLGSIAISLPVTRYTNAQQILVEPVVAAARAATRTLALLQYTASPPP